MALRRLVCACALMACGTAANVLVDTDLFVGGEGGYFCYRLPNMLQLGTPGHMLVIAQGHKYDCQDSGRMDILARSTTDNGRTWSNTTLVYSESSAEKNVTIGTPSSVVDQVTGTVHLFVSREFKQILLLSSSDSGLSWSAPRDLTDVLVPTEWSGVWTGLPQGIQLMPRGDIHRLMLCANHGTPDGTRSHTIYSDDHGATWLNGESVGPNHMGECSLAETSAGVFMYARVWWDDHSGSSTSGNSAHALAHSTDGGVNFSPGNTSAFPGSFVDCQGAIAVANSDTFLVGAPYGYNHFPRQNYTVLMSRAVDGFPSEWTPLPGADPLFAGASEYSTLAVPTAEVGTFFVIYERGAQYDGKGALRLTQLRIPDATPTAVVV